MKKLTLAILLILSAAPALGLTPDQIAQQQLVIQQQQEQLRHAEDQRRELRESQRIHDTRADGAADDIDGADDAVAGATDSADVDAGASSASGASTDGASATAADCARFAIITVLGNTVYSDTRIRKITEWYIGRCITRDNMSALQNELTALYIDRKYTLARVYFDQRRSNLTRSDSPSPDGSGATGSTVVFIIEEGIVNKVELQEVFPDTDACGAVDHGLRRNDVVCVNVGVNAGADDSNNPSAQSAAEASTSAELPGWQRFRQSSKTL